MENRSHALIAGLFTLLLGVAAVLSLWWFGGKHEATREYLVVTGKSIAGLNVQAQVRYRGIRVGKVEAISFDREDYRQTLIRIRIREDVPITAGTLARLGVQGVTGIAHVQLEDDGRNPVPLAEGANGLPRIAMGDSMLEEMTSLGRATLHNVREAVTDINRLLGPENQQMVSRTLGNLEMASSDARQASQQLRQLFSPENTRLLHSALQRAEYTLGEAGPFFAEARGLVSRLQQLGEKLDVALGEPATDGVGALAPRANELARELAVTSRQLGRVLQMLEESPQSLIFGQQKTPPGPGEAGFVAPVTNKGK